jgi:type VI secretion system secreted protein Hcp
MAAVDYFLKIDGIPGESKDDKHPDEIQLESWSWGATNSGSMAAGGGGGAGKVNVQDFSFTMTVNKASPELFLACATGKHIDSAKLTCRKAGGEQQEFFKITFTKVMISSYQTGGSGGDIIPVESITFNFEKMEYSYAPQKEDGGLDAEVVHSLDLKKMSAS